MAEYVGVDIGGTKVAAALVNDSGQILKRSVLPTQAKKGLKTVLTNVIECINEVCDYEVKGIGVGCPGPLDPVAGVIKKTLNLPFNNTRLKEILWKRFRTKVRIDNDANVYALGEATFGAGKGKDNIVMITLGTGVGTGIIINGKIYHGRANAGEAGHISLDYKGLKKPGSKNTGDAELYLGTQGILKRAQGLKAKEVLDLYTLAKMNNKKALKVWGETGFLLGVLLADLTYTLDPDRIIIGGNISGAWKYFEKKLKQTLKERLFFSPPPVLKTKLGGNAPLLGAASLVMKK